MKNTKLLFKALILSLVIISISTLFFYSFRTTNDKEKFGNRIVNPQELDGSLLISNSGSPFKDSIISEILSHYKSTSVEIEIINNRSLNKVNIDDFDAVLILHRWEADAPSKFVSTFMEENSDLESKIVMLTTSWNGLEKMENIDAITGASIIEDVPKTKENIIERLNHLLKR